MKNLKSNDYFKEFGFKKRVGFGKVTFERKALMIIFDLFRKKVIVNHRPDYITKDVIKMKKAELGWK